MLEPLLKALEIERYRHDIPLYAKERLEVGRLLNVHELSRGQREFLEDMIDLDKKKVLISAARGSGKTLTLAILATWSVDILPYYFESPYEVTILSGSMEQSQILYSYCKKFFTNTNLVERLEREPTKSFTLLQDGSNLKCLTASEKQVRGPHPDTLIIDEACEASDDLIKAAFPQVASSRHGRIVMCSTPHVYFSIFVEMWNRPEFYGYDRYHWDALQCDWISRDHFAHAEKTLDKYTFEVNWMGLPSAITGTYVNPEDLRTAIVEETQMSKEPELICMGIDWGYVHPTVITVAEKVADSWNILFNKSYERKRFSELQKTIQDLTERFNVQKIFTDAEDIGENQRLKEAGLPITPVNFHNAKHSLISNMQSLFEHKRIKIPSKFEGLIEQVGNYTPETKSKDDHVDSLMLTVKVRQKMERPSIFDYRLVKRERKIYG